MHTHELAPAQLQLPRQSLMQKMRPLRGPGDYADLIFKPDSHFCREIHPRRNSLEKTNEIWEEDNLSVNLPVANMLIFAAADRERELIEVSGERGKLCVENTSITFDETLLRDDNGDNTTLLKQTSCFLPTLSQSVLPSSWHRRYCQPCKTHPQGDLRQKSFSKRYTVMFSLDDSFKAGDRILQRD
jgi:hypothetical protein